jgi:hypothetical protein
MRFDDDVGGIDSNCPAAHCCTGLQLTFCPATALNVEPTSHDTQRRLLDADGERTCSSPTPQVATGTQLG